MTMPNLPCMFQVRARFLPSEERRKLHYAPSQLPKYDACLDWVCGGLLNAEKHPNHVGESAWHPVGIEGYSTWVPSCDLELLEESEGI